MADDLSTNPSASLALNNQGAGILADLANDPHGFRSTEISNSQALAAGPDLQVVSPLANITGFLKNRLVFSTVNEQVRAPKTLTLSNTGSQTLTISSLSFGDSQEKENAVRPFDHQRGDDFSSVDTLRLPITIAPGASTSIRVQFIPRRNASLDPGDSPTHTVNAENYALLTINSNDPSGPTKVNLAGLNSTNYEGDSEVSLAEIVRSFGWTTDIGSEDNKLGLSKTLLGDEVYSPYWVRANASLPVELWPLAVYSSRSDSTHDTVRFVAKAGSGGNSGTIYSLAGRDRDDNVPGSNTISGGENQKLLPKILVNNVNTLPTSSSVDFNPTSPFALQRGEGFTDDNLNGPSKTHGWRIFALRDANGIIVPDTFIATTDLGTNVVRNGDFNDDVYLFKNVNPESRALAPAVGALVPGSPDLIFNFNESYPGTLEDINGETIGFSSTQLNQNDGYTPTASYQSSLLDINPAAGTLSVTSTAGINSSDNNLINGLLTKFDGRAGKAMITTKLLGSLSYLDAGFEQAGLMFGPNDDNYIKLVARNSPTGGVGIEFNFENNGVGDRMGEILPIPDPSTLQSLELMLFTDPLAGTIRAAYRAIGAAGDTGIVNLPSFISLKSKGSEFGHFFAPQSKAGILTSDKGGAQFTATFDNFAIFSNETTAARNTLYRLDVGDNASFPPPAGWSSDLPYLTPADATSETGANSPADIANTDNDGIYRTYRAKIGTESTPLENRILSYNLPVASPGAYDVRLHFAEIFFGVPGGGPAGSGIGSRVFDILVEGKTLLRNFDITAAAGDAMTAIVVSLEDIQVTDGNLKIALRADVNFGAISGIEVLQKV